MVRNPESLFADPQLLARGHFVFMDQAEMGRYASDGNCFTLSRAEPEYRPSPLLGEHTEYVCKNLLGLTTEEHDQLRVDGVLS